MCITRIKHIVSTAVVFVLTAAASGSTWFMQYNADSNSLPDKQGWDTKNDTQESYPWMESGTLRMDTTIDQKLYWDRTDRYICYPADTGFVVEWRMKVNSSGYEEIPNNRWRIGFTVWVTDWQGRLFIIGISSAGAIISRDSNWGYGTSSPFVAFNSTDGFHTYHFTVQDDVGQLWVDDDTFLITLAVGQDNQGTENRVIFGDATYHTDCDVEIAWLRCGQTTRPGDTDNDGEINMTDLETMAYYWLDGTCACMSCCEGADLNHSGAVNLTDLAQLAAAWMLT